MELALSLEKLNFQRLRELHEVAAKHNDPSMTDFIEGKLLAEQVRVWGEHWRSRQPADSTTLLRQQQTVWALLP